MLYYYNLIDSDENYLMKVVCANCDNLSVSFPKKPKGFIEWITKKIESFQLYLPWLAIEVWFYLSKITDDDEGIFELLAERRLILENILY